MNLQTKGKQKILKLVVTFRLKNCPQKQKNLTKHFEIKQKTNNFLQKEAKNVAKMDFRAKIRKKIFEQK